MFPRGGPPDAPLSGFVTPCQLKAGSATVYFQERINVFKAGLEMHALYIETLLDLCIEGCICVCYLPHLFL